MSFSAYKNMKPSGDSWLGDIPSHWESAPLKAMARVDNSGCYGLDPEEPGKVLPVATTAQIGSDGSFDVDRMPQRAFTPSEVERYSCREGDILVVKSSGSAENIISGKAGYISPETPTFIFSNFLMRLVPFKGVAFPKFVYLLLVSHLTRERIKQMCSTTTYPNLQVGLYSGAKLPCPPSDEQQKIAAFLDYETAKIDALIAEQQRLIELLKEKRQAVISRAVTKGLNPNAPMKDSGVEWLGEVPAHWKVVAIKWITPVLRGASPRPIDDPVYFEDEGEYAWVRIADVSASDGILSETTQRLSNLGASLSVKLEPGEMFLSIAGTVGKPCITNIKACIHDGFVFFPELKMPNKYLYRIFEAGLCYGGLGKMGTQLNLNTDTVGGIKIALPGEDEIDEVLAVLDRQLVNIDELIEQAKDTSQLLKERRTALISAAVTGKIDVRGWQPSESSSPVPVLQAAEEAASYG